MGHSFQMKKLKHRGFVRDECQLSQPPNQAIGVGSELVDFVTY